MDLYGVFKSAEKLYAAIPQQFRFLKGRALPPLQVVFELTYRCNLTCEFCYQRREEDLLGVKYSRNELTTDEIKSIVDQTAPWTLIIFSGGEVFIRKDALEILSYAAKKRRCHIVTNATYITPEIAERLVDMGLTSVGISIEGREEIHDKIRGRKTFAKATAAARMLVEYRKKRGKRFPLVNLKTTITEGNVDHLAELVNLTEELGADYCSFQIMNTSVMISGMYLYDTLEPYRQSPPPIANFPLNVLQEQLRLVGERAAKSGATVRFSPGLTAAQIQSHYANEVSMHDYTCAAPWTGMNISPQGEVFPCFNYRIGNLRQNRLMELWNGERYRKFRRTLMVKGQFAGCQGCCDLIPKAGHAPVTVGGQNDVIPLTVVAKQ